MPYWSSENSIDISHEQPREFEPNYAWHEGMGDAVMNAPVNVGSRLLQSAYLMGGGLLNYSAGLFDGETAEFLEREGDAAFQVVDKLQKHLDDNYRESAGWAAGLVQNVGEIVGGVAATGAVGYGSTYAATEAAREVAEGKDVGTALALGTVRGGAITIGALAPAAIGATIGQKVLSGAGINVGVGIAQRGTEKAILSGEYQNEADQLMVLDPIAIFADTIMGGAFGVFARQSADAAEAVSKLKKVDDEAPVKLKTAEDVAVHRDNMREVVRAELEGDQPVLKENVAPIKKTDVQRYSEIKGTEGGRKIDVDMARDLDPDYVAGKKEAFDVQEFASKVADDAYLSRLENPDASKLPVVEAMAGGAGSGKSTALENAGADLSQANVILDATPKTYASAISKIEAALASGHAFQVNYVLADVKTAWARALLRAERSGRAVPAEVFLATHTGALKTVKRLASEFDGSKSVLFRFFDNRGDINDVKQIGFDELSKIDNNVSIKELEDIANDLRSSGKISNRTHQKSIGKARSEPDAGAKAPASGVSREVGEGDSGRAQEEYQPSPETVMADGRTYAQSKAASNALIVREKRIAEQVTSALNCLLTGA